MRKNLKVHVENIKKLFLKGFYFSYNFDLTSSLQRQYNVKKNASGIAQTFHEMSDHRYYWNHNMYEDFFSQNIHPRWFVPIIQGSVSISNLSVLG